MSYQDKTSQGHISPKPLSLGQLKIFRWYIVAQLATEILNISYIKSVVGPIELLLRYYICYFMESKWQMQQKY
jgi:hypothetical protein